MILAPACLNVSLYSTPSLSEKGPEAAGWPSSSHHFHSDWWLWSLLPLPPQLTHGVMNKELKYCKNPEDLECNENVKHKTKEYIKKYMQKFGAVYKPKEDTELE